MNRPPNRPLWTELPLVLVHATVVAGFARLYEDGTFFWPLIALVLGAHLLAIGCRRARVSAPATAAIAVIGGALAITWAVFPSTVRLGLPTAQTWTAVGEALRQAKARYPVVVAPTKVLVGFQLVAGAALWVAVWFSDWTANRMRATGESVATAVAIFGFCSILGAGPHEVLLAGLFGASLLIFVAVQRMVALEVPATRAALVRGALAVGAVAVLAGTLIGPRLPGADSEASIDWRNHSGGDRSRVTVSPMVELKKRLVDQSDALLFEVRSSQRAYWRLTSLDRFDGEIWASSGEFRPADSRLPSEAPPDQAADRITQTVRIDALAAIWVPTAFEAISVRESDQPLRWDPDSSTLIVESSRETSDGLRYEVVSRAPTYTSTVLERSDGRDPRDIVDRYLGLPDDFPVTASKLASQVTRGSTSRYQQALALQDYFRTNFTYSLSSPAGHSDSALLAFLQSGEGYCEQFAGAYAAMARSLGMPARVAVGFTPGNPDPEDPTLYRVLGRHAHAWPEVYFAGLGWVPFEPTPGRGIPSAEAYTQVREQQDQGQPINITTTAPPSSTSSTAPEASTTRPRTTTPDRIDSEGATPAVRDASEGGGTSAAAVAAALVAAGTLGALAVRRRRRIRGTVELSGPDRRWQEVEATLATGLGLRAEPAETPVELARRAGDVLGAPLDADLAEAAELVTESRWSPTGLDADRAARLDELVAGVVAAGQADGFGGSGSSSPSPARSRLRTRSPVSPK